MQELQPKPRCDQEAQPTWVRYQSLVLSEDKIVTLYCIARVVLSEDKIVTLYCIARVDPG